MTTKMADIAKFISSNPLFFSLKSDHIEEIASKFKVLRFNPHDTIIKEGEPGDSFYILKEGHVRVIKESPEGENILAELAPPEGFGEMAILIDEQRTATIKAVDSVETLQLIRDDFLHLVKETPDLLLDMKKLLDSRVSFLEDEQFVTKDFKEKLKSYEPFYLDFPELDNLNKLNASMGREQVEHCKETAILAKEMCKVLCPQIADELVYAGLLHEIGKVSLSKNLLEKERRGEVLSPEEKEEFSEIYKHAVEILHPNKELAERVSFIKFLGCENFWDMPIEAQILKVANDYEELIRPDYRNVPSEEAMEIIKRESGTRYNTRVVKALETIVDKFSLINVERQIRSIMHINISLDKKDYYTMRHSFHVRDMALEIAKKLNLSRREHKMLKLGCELHDVGKIHVPYEILNAPRSLTLEEHEFIKKHPIWSESYLIEIPGMKSLAKIVRSHHEKYDGTGYPDGLKGEEIPFFSRIMAIADVYSALTMKRVYRDSMSYAEALRTMEGMKGSFFPDLFDVYREIISEKIANGETRANRLF
jgi:HD-GYP domain-containing protein (c-di-GMP phosphodiesterase class II)